MGQISIRLSMDAERDLKNAAVEQGKTLAQYCRDILSENVPRETMDETPKRTPANVPHETLMAIANTAKKEDIQRVEEDIFLVKKELEQYGKILIDLQKLAVKNAESLAPIADKIEKSNLF